MAVKAGAVLVKTIRHTNALGGRETRFLAWDSQDWLIVTLTGKRGTYDLWNYRNSKSLSPNS